MQNMEKINHRESTVRQKWVEYLNHFLKNRMYLCILLLTAICAYGYKVTNVTIGIDDTPSLYYFEEGLIAIVGRWVLFLLNKICSIAEFLPFLTDFAAVVLLVIAAIVWSALFYSVFDSHGDARLLLARGGVERPAGRKLLVGVGSGDLEDAHACRSHAADLRAGVQGDLLGPRPRVGRGLLLSLIHI